MDAAEGLRDLADSAPVMIRVSSAGNGCTWLNRAWLEFVGRSMTQELGRGWEESVHPDDIANCVQAYQAALETHERVSVEYRLRRHDGEYRWILDQGAPCFDEDGAFRGYIGSAVDVTERKRSWQMPSADGVEVESPLLAEALPNLVWTCEPDGWCDSLGRQWVEYTGRPGGEQVGYGWAEHVHPDDRERVRAAWKAATARGDAYETEFRIRAAAGTYRWFQTRAVPVRDATGHVVKWFGSNTDCDAQKRAERQLRLQLERLRVHELLRARRAELPTPARQRAYRAGGAVLRQRHGGRPRRRQDEPFTWTAAGVTERFEARYAASPLPAIQARRQRTANVELEERVQQRTLALEAANEELEAFCNFVTADALSPLRALRALSERFWEEFANELPLRAAEMLRQIDTNAGKLEKVTSDLLWLGRLSRRPMTWREVDLDALATRVIKRLVDSRKAKVRDIRLHAGGLGSCYGDTDLLEQLFSSLLSNALEYTRHKTKASIEVARAEDDAGVTYLVKDNGMGFDMNHAQRLFTPFQRLHAGRSPEGSGVGLAGVYRIVQRHGGQIWAQAAPGRGATFYFTLPRAFRTRRRD